MSETLKVAPSNRYQRARGLGPGAPRVPREELYFVQDGEAGWIKIGYALDVDARFRHLQCGNPRPLELLTTLRLDNAREVEGHLHTCFHSSRGRGEWFRHTADLDRLIRVIGRAATPDEVISSVILIKRQRTLKWAIRAHGLTVEDWRALGSDEAEG